MPAPALKPFFVGEVTEEGPYGPTTVAIAVVIQRRMSRKGMESWVIACPYCGGVHQHGRGPGEGGRAPHCGPEVGKRRDYYLFEANHLPVVPNDARAEADLRRRGWIGKRRR